MQGLKRAAFFSKCSVNRLHHDSAFLQLDILECAACKQTRFVLTLQKIVCKMPDNSRRHKVWQQLAHSPSILASLLAYFPPHLSIRSFNEFHLTSAELVDMLHTIEMQSWPTVRQNLVYKHNERRSQLFETENVDTCHAEDGGKLIF